MCKNTSPYLYIDLKNGCNGMNKALLFTGLKLAHTVLFRKNHV